jgi:hypothetical protein
MVTSVTKDIEHRNCPKNVWLSEHTDITIHWKALSDGTIGFLFQPFYGENAFSDSPSKTTQELNNLQRVSIL